jgi:hypothetical protein
MSDELKTDAVAPEAAASEVTASAAAETQAPPVVSGVEPADGTGRAEAASLPAEDLSKVDGSSPGASAAVSIDSAGSTPGWSGIEEASYHSEENAATATEPGTGQAPEAQETAPLADAVESPPQPSDASAAASGDVEAQGQAIDITQVQGEGSAVSASQSGQDATATESNPASAEQVPGGDGSSVEPAISLTADENLFIEGAAETEAALVRVRLEAAVAENAKLQATVDCLRDQLGLTSEAFDQTRAEFEQAKDGLKADVIALVDDLADRIASFQEKASALQAIPAGDRVRVFLRQPMIVGGEPKEIGTTLGFITLSPGVTPNFLIDAVRNGFAKCR